MDETLAIGIGAQRCSPSLAIARLLVWLIALFFLFYYFVVGITPSIILVWPLPDF